MNKTLLSLAILSSVIWLSGCNTTTTALTQLSPDAVSTEQLMGGKIGLQLAAASNPAEMQTNQDQKQLVTSNERAYKDWKRSNRS